MTADLFDNLAEAERRIGLAVRAALLDHKRTGDPIEVWQDGTVIWISASEIQVPDAEDNANL